MIQSRQSSRESKALAPHINKLRSVQGPQNTNLIIKFIGNKLAKILAKKSKSESDSNS